MFNKAMIAPIAALIAIVVKDTLGVEIQQEQVENVITVILAIIAAIGFKMNWKK